MERASLETPVALLFFARPQTFRLVFEAVRRARPRRLFLVQDGPREGHPEDAGNIAACRAIAEGVDWECEVARNYASRNMGCGLRPSSGISWVFEQVEVAIILEDDCVPEDGVFAFCDNLLRRFRDDTRVCMASGFNHFGRTDCGTADYFFAKTAAIWGWATWRRVWRQYDFSVRAADDESAMRQLEREPRHPRAARRIVKNLRKTRRRILLGETPSYWDTQWEWVKYSQNMVGIVPAGNLIRNIGIGDGSTHSAASLHLLPGPIARFFLSGTSAPRLPPEGPAYMLCRQDYDARYYRTVYPPLPVRILRKIGVCLRRLFGPKRVAAPKT